jgi:hypothetical protein
MERVSAGEADGDVVDEPNKYCCCLWPAVRVSEEMGSKKEGRRSGIMGGKMMRVADQKRFTDRKNPGAGSYASSTMRQCSAPVVVKRWGDRGEGLGVMASVQKKGQRKFECSCRKHDGKGGEVGLLGSPFLNNPASLALFCPGRCVCHAPEHLCLRVWLPVLKSKASRRSRDRFPLAIGQRHDARFYHNSHSHPTPYNPRTIHSQQEMASLEDPEATLHHW